MHEGYLIVFSNIKKYYNSIARGFGVLGFWGFGAQDIANLNFS